MVLPKRPQLPVILVANDLVEGEVLFRTARKTGAALVPMHTIRGIAELAAVHRAVRAGEIGEPLLSFSQKTYKWGRSRPDFYRSRETFPGLAPWVGIHAFDWLHWILGDVFAEVMGREGTTARPDYRACGSQAAFVLTMRGAGIHVRATKFTATTPAGAQPLASVSSPPMATLVRLMDVRSDDYFAEMLAKQLGVRFGGAVSTAAGARVITSALAGLDIYPTRSWDTDALIQPKSRAAFASLLAQGWRDALRDLHPSKPMFTFWDYKRNRWPRDAGLRLDHLLLSPALAPRLMKAGVDRKVRGEEGASDHAPAWIVLK